MIPADCIKTVPVSDAGLKEKYSVLYTLYVRKRKKKIQNLVARGRAPPLSRPPRRKSPAAPLRRAGGIQNSRDFPFRNCHLCTNPPPGRPRKTKTGTETKLPPHYVCPILRASARLVNPSKRRNPACFFVEIGILCISNACQICATCSKRHRRMVQVTVPSIMKKERTEPWKI